jgi:hypothetical protein
MYKFLKWNGKYGDGAKFVVQNMETEEQALFTPGEMEDITWTHAGLDEADEFKNWSDFGEEKVEDLADVAF